MVSTQITIRLPKEHLEALQKESSARNSSLDEIIESLIEDNFPVGPHITLTVDGKSFTVKLGTIQEAQLLIAQGKYINGVKHIRQSTSLGLKDSKDIADILKNDLRHGVVR